MKFEFEESCEYDEFVLNLPYMQIKKNNGEVFHMIPSCSHAGDVFFFMEKEEHLCEEATKLIYELLLIGGRKIVELTFNYKDGWDQLIRLGIITVKPQYDENDAEEALSQL